VRAIVTTVQINKNGGVGLKRLPLVFPREKAIHQLPLQFIFWIFLGYKTV
jgi:hypothetical protein